jgi:outer membrane translocation and assembly module TamA
LQLNFGEVPFLDMAKVGNDDILRGYPRNRFRDKHFTASQIEYRFPVYKRFGAVAFTGLGDVFSDINQLSLNTLKYSIGGGLRYAINKKERLNIRLDYAIGRNENAFYLMVTEAF